MQIGFSRIVRKQYCGKFRKRTFESLKKILKFQKKTWKIPKDVSWGEGIMIGIAQGFATLPGLSRSGSTISACTFCGLERRFAVKFSFLLSIPAILGAALLELKDIGGEVITAQTGISYAAGMIAAAAVGFLSIRFLLALVRGRKMKYFAWYCFAMGTFAIIGQFVFM